MAWQIGVDVGGTFTDLLALDPEHGIFRVAKVPSTPEDQSVGFIAGLAALETDLAAVAALVHGTTVATNPVLERQGARCGLITTAGFRDVLELGRRTRPNPYGMTGSFEALIPRDLRAEVPERIDAAGRVLRPLDEAAGGRGRQRSTATSSRSCRAISAAFHRTCAARGSTTSFWSCRGMAA